MGRMVQGGRKGKKGGDERGDVLQWGEVGGEENRGEGWKCKVEWGVILAGEGEGRRGDGKVARLLFGMVKVREHWEGNGIGVEV